MALGAAQGARGGNTALRRGDVTVLCKSKRSLRPESNQRPKELQSSALPLSYAES